LRRKQTGHRDAPPPKAEPPAEITSRGRKKKTRTKRGQSTDKHGQQGNHKQNTAVDQKNEKRKSGTGKAPGGGTTESSKPTKTNISISDLLFENGKRKEQNV
jgi:hypothetical protein